MIYQNVQELAVEADMSVIPAHSLTFCENAIAIAEAVDADYNKLFQSVGIHELAVYESTGEEVVYEAEEKKTLINKVVEFFKSLWAKIKAGFEAILLKFESLKKEVRNRIPNITKEMVMNCDKKSFGKTHEFNIDKNNEYIENAKNFSQVATDEFKKAYGDDGKDTTKEKLKEKKDELEKRICKEVSGFDVAKVSEMTKKIHEKLLGAEVEATKGYVHNNLSTILGIVKDGNSKDTIKKNYKEFKKLIDNAIKEAKSTEDAKMGIINHLVYILKEIMGAANAANNAVMDVCKRRYNEYRNILLRVSVCVQKQGKGEKKQEEATGESAAPDVTANQVQMIESLFAW